MGAQPRVIVTMPANRAVARPGAGMINGGSTCKSKMCDLKDACTCGKVRGGLAMIIIGIIFLILGLIFVCGFVPCCCFAGPDVPAAPAVAGAAPVQGVVVQGKM